MGKPRKLTAEEEADFERRSLEFRKLLEHRREVDTRLEAERQARDAAQN